MINVAEKIDRRIEEVKAATKAAFDGLVNCHTHEALSDVANHVAHLAGRRQCLEVLKQSWNHKPEPAHLLLMVASQFTHGADDSWSGRGNDNKRCKHDGYCEEGRYWLSAIEFNMGLK
jgi:hypothetical protein